MTNMKLPTCDYPGCPGHLGKFSSCIDEAVWTLAMDGFDVDSTGDASDWGMWAGEVSLPTGETVEMVDPKRTVDVPAGVYLVLVYDNGRVETESRPVGLGSEITARLEAIRSDYETWLDDNEQE